MFVKPHHVPPLLCFNVQTEMRFRLKQLVFPKGRRCKKMMSERQGMSDAPLCFALELTRTHNHKLYQYITNLSNSCEDFDKYDAALRGKIRNSQRT